MRKIAFYSRLAAGNLWRNRSTYLPYLLACVVSIFTFYTMLAINHNGVLDNMRGESVVKSFTAIGSIILALFCSVLIFYTNSFLIKRRKKELGLYSVLGMEKRNIAALMFFETLFVAALALALGLALGLLLSKLIYWVLLRLIQFPVMLDMPASPAALGFTAAFFGIVFLLALCTNLLQVRLANPVGLMAGARQGEKEPRASWLLTAAGLLCLGGGYFIALYFTSPVEVILYFLAAVALVIVGTYCLFTSGSIALLKLLRKNKRYYYQPRHFISVSGMIYRMKQNAAGLATICILSCMVLVTVSSTVSLNVGAEDSLRYRFPYEYRVNIGHGADAGAVVKAAEAAAQKSGTAITTLHDYRSAGFMADEADGVFTTSENYSGRSTTYISLRILADYNRSEGRQAALAPGEALLLVTGGSYPRDSLTLNGVSYTVSRPDSLGKIKQGSGDVGRSLTLVVPDEAAAAALMGIDSGELGAYFSRDVGFDLEGGEEAKALFTGFFKEELGRLPDTGYESLSLREENKQEWYASNGGFLFLGIYFGVLFMLAAALIIYYKQMSEGYDDAERFEILQKVGMGEEEVKKTINSQILAVFFLPLAVAVAHIVVAFFPISRAMVVFGVLNVPMLAAATAATVLAYALVYWLVFRRTAKTYFRIVRRGGAA